MKIQLTAVASASVYDGLAINTGSGPHSMPEDGDLAFVAGTSKKAREIAVQLMRGNYPSIDLEPLRHAINGLHDKDDPVWSVSAPIHAKRIHPLLDKVMKSLKPAPAAAQAFLAKVAHDEHELAMMSPLKPDWSTRAWMNACYVTLFNLLRLAQLAVKAKTSDEFDQMVRIANTLKVLSSRKVFDPLPKQTREYAIFRLPKAKATFDGPLPSKERIRHWMAENGVAAAVTHGIDRLNSLQNYPPSSPAPAGKLHAIVLGTKEFPRMGYYLVGDKIFATGPDSYNVRPLTDIDGRPFKAPAQLLARIQKLVPINHRVLHYHI